MSAQLRVVRVRDADLRLFSSDAPLTAADLETISAERAAIVELRGRAARGRDPRRLDILAELPSVIGIELHHAGRVDLPDVLLERLEILGLFGRCDTTVSAKKVPKLRIYGGPADRLEPGRFTDNLRRLVVTSWHGEHLRDLPSGDGLEELDVTGHGQHISIVGVDAPRLRSLEVVDVVIDSLDGAERLTSVERLAIHPPRGDVAAGRTIDLAPLSGATSLRWLVVGRQGHLVGVESVARLPQLAQVLAYESFMPPEFRNAPWASILPDPRGLRRPAQ